jgi:amino acid adenylation domain-containing protein
MASISQSGFTHRTHLPATDLPFGEGCHVDSAQSQRHREMVYWKKQLEGAPAVLDLPTYRPRPPGYSYRAAREDFALDEGLSLKLQELSRQEGVTLFVTLLAAFDVLLARYTRQEDIVVGVPVAMRTRRETNGRKDALVNTLPLRTDLAGNPTFRQLLQQVRQVEFEAFTHRDVPFEELVEELQQDGTLSHSPLFQVLFVLQNDSGVPSEIERETIAAAATDSLTAKYDLTLTLAEKEEQLQGTLTYNAELFDAGTAAWLLGHFHVLLEGIVADPGRRLGQLPLLTEAERRLLLTEWNRTETAFPADRCIHELFEAQVERTPEAVAVILGNQQLSYRELNARANQVAHYLRQQGIASETLVGLALEPSLEVVIGLLGILKGGGAYVPLDPSYPKERLAFLMQDSQIPVLLTQERLVADLPDQARVVRLDADWNLISSQSTANPACTVSAENLAYVIYTSGSTGKPKGIMVPHRGLVNYLSWCVNAYAVEAGVGAPVHSSISFDLTITCLFAPLMVGRAVEFFPRSGDVRLLQEAFGMKRNYSLVKITPAHLELLGTQISPEEAAGRTRAFIIGGENLSAHQIAFWQEHAPDTVLVNEYGPTETVVGCCVYRVPSGKPQSRSIPIGRPIANTQLYVLDHHLQLVPIGVPGELYIGGAGLARGYLNRPELTAERFIPHPFRNEPGARLYKTGDLVRWLPDGNLEFLGRLDQQVKLRGFRIEPGEIEAALAEHPQVREAVVILREDRPGYKRLVGYVVARQGTAPLPSDLRGYLGQKLPAYMVPSAIVVLERLPLTPNSKVDRRALPVPEGDRTQQAHPYAAPRTPTEELLAGIWKDLLGLDQVGIHEDFYELAGDSLLAVHLFAQIEKVFGLRLPVATLFQGATIEQLAKILQDPLQLQPGTKIVEFQSGGSRAPIFFLPSFACEVTYCKAIAKYLDPDQPVYGIQPCLGNGQAHKSAPLEAMAADYIKALRAFQPDDPYYLAGYSFAGLVAFEMAQQLTAEGCRVKLLAIIDSRLPRPGDESVMGVFRGIVPFLFNLPLWLRDDLFHSPLKETLARIGRRLKALGKRHSGFQGSPLRESGWRELEVLYNTGRLSDHYLRLIEANLRASRGYVPRPYRGRITLVRARTQPLFCRHGADLGWRRIAAGGLSTSVIPGTHDSILKEPHVRLLARGLKDELSRASGEPGTTPPEG